MRWTIGFRLGFLLACFSLGAALLVGYFTFAAGRDMLNERARSTLLATTQILTQHLQTGFGSVARDTSLLASLVAQTQDRDAPGAAQVLDKDRLASAFRAMLTARPAYLQIRWISAQVPSTMNSSSALSFASRNFTNCSTVTGTVAR